MVLAMAEMLMGLMEAGLVPILVGPGRPAPQTRERLRAMNIRASHRTSRMTTMATMILPMSNSFPRP